MGYPDGSGQSGSRSTQLTPRQESVSEVFEKIAKDGPSGEDWKLPKDA